MYFLLIFIYILTGYQSSRYTYGKPVKGEATITCYPTIYSGVIQPLYQNPIRKVIQLDGKATAEFDLVGELQLTDEYERTVVIDATVEESLTGRRQNSSTQVQIHKYKYKMELIKTSEYFKPQLKYTAFVSRNKLFTTYSSNSIWYIRIFIIFFIFLNSGCYFRSKFHIMMVLQSKTTLTK